MGLIRKAASMTLGGLSNHGRRDPQAKAAKARAGLAEAETEVAEEQAAAIAKALHEDEAHRQTWRRSPRKRPRLCRGTGQPVPLVPPQYTANAREVLGPDKILVVGLTAAVDERHPVLARAAARRFVSETVARPGSPYAVNLTRLGYAAEEISAASDEVVDAIVAWGSPERILAGIRKHLDAGADHVRLGTIAPDFQAGLDALDASPRR